MKTHIGSSITEDIEDVVDLVEVGKMLAEASGVDPSVIGIESPTEQPKQAQGRPYMEPHIESDEQLKKIRRLI